MALIPPEALNLFIGCFPESGDETAIILDYAAKHGKIHILNKNGVAANMVCTANISDKGFNAQYIFAAGTKPEYRNKGLFRKHLEDIIGNSPALLIPENESLFPMYEKLGFRRIYCLEADTNGDGSAINFTGDINELYEIYKSSYQFPKKDIALFEATVTAHLIYGGEIKIKNGSAVLISDGNAVDIFAINPKNAVEAAKRANYGKYKAILPLICAKELEAQNIHYRKKSIAMGKNIENAEIYLNTLFN